jgi:hypothetical protein
MNKILAKIQIGIFILLSFTQTTFAVNIDDLLPPTTKIPENYDETQTLANLPNVTVEQAIATTIKTILGWTMIITIVAIVVAGIFYMIAEGDEEKTGKAKKILVSLAIGMAIISAAYGVINGLTQIDFFN